jgi:hypothetical protein
MAQAPSIPAADVPFEEQATAVLRRLRASVVAVIEAIPSAASIGRAADLQRALAIRNTLAWQVYRLAYATGPLAEASAIPGSGAMNGFFEAAAARGVRADVIAAAKGAVADFQAVVQAHAGDRSAFDSMLSAIHGAGAEQIDLQHKRAAYKANSHIWGVRARAQLSCFVFHPSRDDPDRLDLLGIRGLIGLRRLRRDASWIIARVRLFDAESQKPQHLDPGTPIDPIDPREDGAPAVPLLRRYCSQPLPKFTCVPAGNDFVNVQLEPTGIGDKSAITGLIGDVYRGLYQRYRDERRSVHYMRSQIRTPCEVLVHDVLIYDGLFEGRMPELRIYGDHRGVDPAAPDREMDLLPMSETVAHLGRGPDVLSTPDVPRYVEMVRYALDRAGWDPSRFDIYRCRVEYPIMPSTVALSWDLPEKPG